MVVRDFVFSLNHSTLTFMGIKGGHVNFVLKWRFKECLV